MAVGLKPTRMWVTRMVALMSGWIHKCSVSSGMMVRHPMHYIKKLCPDKYEHTWNWPGVYN